MWLALIARYWSTALLAGVALALVVSIHSCNAEHIATGRALERSRVADSALAELAKAKAKTDTVYRRDTLRLVQRIARVDTLRETVLHHLTDTLTVKEYVTATDSALKVCSAVRLDCDEYRRISTAELAELRVKLAAASSVSPRSCLATGLWSALGAGGGIEILHRLKVLR